MSFLRSSGGKIDLIGVQTVTTAVASVTQTGLDLTKYSSFEIDVIGLEPSNDSEKLTMQFGTSAGGIYTTAEYYSRNDGNSSAGGSVGASGAGTASFNVTIPNIRSSTYGGLVGSIRIFRNNVPQGGSMQMGFSSQFSFYDQPGGAAWRNNGGGAMSGSTGFSSANFDRFRLQMNTGNILYGKIATFGRKW